MESRYARTAFLIIQPALCICCIGCFVSLFFCYKCLEVWPYPPCGEIHGQLGVKPVVRKLTVAGRHLNRSIPQSCSRGHPQWPKEHRKSPHSRFSPLKVILRGGAFCFQACRGLPESGWKLSHIYLKLNQIYFIALIFFDFFGMLEKGPLETLQVWLLCHIYISRWQRGERLCLHSVFWRINIWMISSLTLPDKKQSWNNQQYRSRGLDRELTGSN